MEDKLAVYCDDPLSGRIKIPVNSCFDFSLLMQKLETQLTEITETVRELRKMEMAITIKVDGYDSD